MTTQTHIRTRTQPQTRSQTQTTHIRQSAGTFTEPRTVAAFRRIKLLLGGYLGVSALTLAGIAVMRHHTAEVDAAVWTRGTIVVASALLTFFFAVCAARGARWAFLRLRIVSLVMVAAVAVIIALPGTFPVWMKIEQGICGLLMLGVVRLVNGKHLRSLFARR